MHLWFGGRDTCYTVSSHLDKKKSVTGRKTENLETENSLLWMILGSILKHDYLEPTWNAAITFQ